MVGDEHVLAPKEPRIYQLSVKDAFEKLSMKERLYAHYMARLALSSAVENNTS